MVGGRKEGFPAVDGKEDGGGGVDEEGDRK